MKNNSTNSTFILALGLILLGAFSRLLPHPMNFTAIGAISLLSGSKIKDRRLSMIIPLTAMLFSDLCIGLHATMIPVYLSIAIISLLGLMMGDSPKSISILNYTLSGSLIFFLVTNLPIWYHSSYSNDFNGLMTSYTAALPFFRNQLAGDLLFTVSLFGIYSFVKSRVIEKAI